MIRLFTLSALIASALLLFPGFGLAQQNPDALLKSIKWEIGPKLVKVGNVAQLQLPAGYQFANAADSRKLMTAMQNTLTNTEVGTVVPVEGGNWFIIFEYEPSGYVKDDDKDALDADAILASLRHGNEQANKERQRRGWDQMQLTGWKQPPFYDPQTSRLTWALLCRVKTDVSVNYNSRLLGRGGVMSVNLVINPEALDATLPTYKKILEGYSFLPGQKYNEYREGDKLAQYGLAALITGTGIAVAAKSGWLMKLLKPLLVGIVAIGAAISGFFKKIFGGGSTSSTE